MGTHGHERSALVLPLTGRFRAIARELVIDVTGDRIGVLPGGADLATSIETWSDQLAFLARALAGRGWSPSLDGGEAPDR